MKEWVPAGAPLGNCNEIRFTWLNISGKLLLERGARQGGSFSKLL